ncbi:uncharacterized protein LOC110876891 [Helianthus annuus]|uniref:uncharacterized protein LOC110876891 n=1 Tax=Helianthus annuus TaxID=4232 RepID=UPI001652D022|nr:uncharacterized protein LOC110876891 [Helianthus annuus]
MYDSLGPAIEAIGRYGFGMKPPTYHEVRVPMLKLEMEHTKKLLRDNEVEKSTYGCSLMVDGWRDRKGRALINFLVNTPQGSMFVESVDASSYSHTGVLRLVDGEKKPPTGYIYNVMKMAKELIAASFKNKEAKYREIFKIIDKRWDCQLHQPLHAARYYLNPGLYYNNPEVEDATEVISGLQTCITKLILTEDEQIQINTELLLYRRADGIFGYPMAEKMRAKLAPAEWWLQYGASAPTLKKFAIKLHSKKRN